jgi:sulfur carrier protein
MSLTLLVNGQSRAFDALSQPISLERVIGELGLKGDRVAVELNGEIVPRTAWAETMVGSGSRLEVVHFVGGGIYDRDLLVY